jgi:hypothetical protein
MTIPEIVKFVRRLASLNRLDALKRIKNRVPLDKQAWAVEGYERLRKAHIWPLAEINHVETLG